VPLVSDYGPRFTLFRVDVPTTFSFQHLAPVITELRNDSVRRTVLTDQETALYVSAHTDDDVVFIEFARHLLISTSEYAERYCLSEMSSVPPVDGSWVPERLQELSAIGHEQIADVFASNKKIAQQACCAVRRDPAVFLQQFGVTSLLWNERSHPEWYIDPLFFVRERQGDGWSLWRVRLDTRQEEMTARRTRAYAVCTVQ
jgi:hypothetical protein